MTRRTASVRSATDFRALLDRRAELEPDPIPDLRRKSRDCFLREGLPHSRMENWRDTRLTLVLEERFEPAGPVAGSTLEEARNLLAGISGPAPRTSPHLVFVNGSFSAALSSLGVLPKGVAVAGLSSGEIRIPREALGGLADPAGHPFTALNGALMTDAAVVEIQDGVRLESPIRITHLSLAGAAASPLTLPRTLLLAGENSQASVIESFAGPNGADRYLVAAVAEIFASAGSSLTYHRVQQEGPGGIHIGRLQAQVESGASFDATSIALGAALDRVDAGVVLAGEEAACRLDGLFVTEGERHADNRTVIEHRVPDCKSRQTYKGILAGRSSAVFMGRVIVHPDAQRTDADQSNPNLLLSDDAAVHTRPQLEIHADDVRCTHGATVGRLDEDSLFYLRTRGIGLEEATRLLIHGFAGEILDNIQEDTLRRRLERELDSRLEACTEEADVQA